MQDDDYAVSQRELWRLFFPLAMSGIFFPLSRPISNGAIARTSSPMLSLAASSVTMGVAMPFIAPLFGLKQVVTALAVDRELLRRLARLTLSLSGLSTFLLLILAIPPVFRYAARVVMGVPADVVELGIPAMFVMAALPVFSVGRGYYQGILVHYGNATPIGYGALANLLGASIAVFVAAIVLEMEGALSTAIAMLFGSVLYLVVVWWPCKPLFAHRIPRTHSSVAPDKRSMRAIVSLYVPLAVSTMITTVIEPAIQIAIARAPNAMLSLAAYPVCVSIAWLTRTHISNAQQVVVASVKNLQSYLDVRRFMHTIAGVTTVLMLLVALPWTSAFVFGTLTGLEGEILDFAVSGYLLLIPVPLINCGRSLYHGTLVSQGTTGGIQLAATIRVVVLILSLGSLVLLTELSGLYLGLVSILVSEIAECASLHISVKRLPLLS
tara:strand:+ start:4328 stop:5641 length:1314 start_codon:yes stop_codon:yes gene_type:complete